MFFEGDEQTHFHDKVSDSFGKTIDFMHLVRQIGVSIQNLFLYVIDIKISLGVTLLDGVSERPPDSMRIFDFFDVKIDPRLTLSQDRSDGIDLG